MLDSVITSTLAGSMICLMLLLFKNKLLKLLGGKTLYRISLFAMLIFVIPFNMINFELPQFTNNPVHTKTLNVKDNIQMQQTDVTAVNNTAPDSEFEKAIPDAVPQLTSMARSENPITLQELLIAVWVLGFLISMGRYFISYRRFKRKICNFEECEIINGVRIIKSPIIASPMIFGFFKPTLAIPEFDMKAEDYELAIKHEMVHFKHHDSWLKLFAVIINSVCWFNPVTYFMINLIGEACEYACDEQVTKEMDLSNKQKYSEMILTMVCQSSPALSSNMAKNKKQLKRRFEMIMKKKNTNIIQRALCIFLMLTMLCSGVVLANEISPLVSSLLKNDYVYITSFSQGRYIENSPIQKNGEYYVPLRQFLNNCKIENDKITYDNGKINIDVWSEDSKVIFDDEKSFNMPGGYIWSTSCEIGKKEVEIAGEKYILKNAPYLDNNTTTYVPYEYIRFLKLYEYTGLEKPEFYDGALNTRTGKFTAVRLFGYDSMENKYYTDDVQFWNIFSDDERLADLSGKNWNNFEPATAEIKKTGYRTELYIKTEITEAGNYDVKAEIEIVLNKVTRVYSRGSDIEGLFTVKVNGKTVYDNEVGYINDLPLKAGKGLCDYGETNIFVGDIRINTWFRGFSNTDDEYSIKSTKNREIDKLADTVTLLLKPEEVKLDGYNAARADRYNVFIYNSDKGYSNFNAEFNDNTDEDYTNSTTYRIDQAEECDAHFIDENTFSTYLQFFKSEARIDSFEAIVTLLPDNKFELKSNNGRYIVRGTTEKYVPLWEWSEEQKQAPLPFINMVNE